MTSRPPASNPPPLRIFYSRFLRRGPFSTRRRACASPLQGGAGREHERLGDLPVRAPESGEPSDFLLAGRKPVAVAASAAAPRSRHSVVPEVPAHARSIPGCFERGEAVEGAEEQVLAPLFSRRVEQERPCFAAPRGLVGTGESKPGALDPREGAGGLLDPPFVVQQQRPAGAERGKGGGGISPAKALRNFPDDSFGLVAPPACQEHLDGDRCDLRSPHPDALRPDELSSSTRRRTASASPWSRLLTAARPSLTASRARAAGDASGQPRASASSRHAAGSLPSVIARSAAASAYPIHFFGRSAR